VDTICKIFVASYSIIPHPTFPAWRFLGFSNFTSNLDLGEWPDCWIFVSFSMPPISRNRSSRTANHMLIKPFPLKSFLVLILFKLLIFEVQLSKTSIRLLTNSSHVISYVIPNIGNIEHTFNGAIPRNIVICYYEWLI